MQRPSATAEEQPAQLRGRSASLPTLGRLPLATSLRFVAFWTAIALPFLYVPLLVGGLGTGEAIAFGGLLLLHVVALRLGHDYNR